MGLSEYEGYVKNALDLRNGDAVNLMTNLDRAISDLSSWGIPNDVSVNAFKAFKTDLEKHSAELQRIIAVYNESAKLP